MNVAYRAGRWSAAHWKTATFGWLAWSSRRILAATSSGTVKLSQPEQSTGRSARAQTLLNESGFHEPRQRDRARAERHPHSGDPAFRRGAGRPWWARLSSAGADRGFAASPLAAGNRGQISQGRARGGDRLQHEGRPNSAADRVQPVLNAVAALQRSRAGLHGRGGRRRQRRARGVTPRSTAGLSQGREAVAADHLPSAADRLRGVRRRRPARAARVLGGARSGRTGGGREPSRARLRCHQLGDAADGHGGRRRLLAVLPQARAGGATRGALTATR